jgi:hypothetical protein
MAVTVNFIDSTPLSGGYKMATFWATMNSSYAAAGGEALNLASYFKAGASIHVFCDTGVGFVLKHDNGNASNGKLLAYASNLNAKNGASEIAAMCEVAAGTNLSTVNTKIVVIGQAY